MNAKMKSILRSTGITIGISAVIFCIIGLIIDLHFHGDFRMNHYGFSKMVLGTLVVGLGFGLPSLIYENDRLPLPLKSLIHMGIGCTIMLITAFATGWIPRHSGSSALIFTILGEIALALLIWFCFYLHNKRLVKRLNEQISKLH